MSITKQKQLETIWRQAGEATSGSLNQDGGFTESAVTLEKSYNICYYGVILFEKVVRMEFSEKVRYVRDKLNISQEDLARALNVSYATVNRWENIKTNPSRMAKVAFAGFCNNHSISFDESEGK